VLPIMGTAHPTGYPTYVLLARLSGVLLQPLGEAALRMNVLSAILVAVGAAFTTDLARRVSGSVLMGVVAGIGTAVTPIVWAVGTHADPHALHLAFLAIILWLLVRWEESRAGSPVDRSIVPAADPDRADRLLLVAAVVVGLSVGNHSLTLLLGPAILLYVVAVDRDVLRRPRFVAAAIAAFVIPTVLVRLEMVWRAGWFRAPFVYANPSTWDGFWYVTLGSQFHDWFTDPFSGWPKRIADLMSMAAGQLGWLAPLVIVGLAVTIVRRPRYAVLSGTTMLLTLVFNAVYPDGAIDRYYIGPALIAWTWLALLGATVVDVVAARVRDGAAEATDGPSRDGALRGAALALVAIALLAPTALAFPARSRLVDDSGDTAAQRWTDDVLRAVEPDAVIVSWWSYSTPLWYATIVDGRRPDVTIIDDRNRVDLNLLELNDVIALYLPTRPVYLIRNGDSELPAVRAKYDVEPVGAPVASNLLRVLPRSGPLG